MTKRPNTTRCPCCGCPQAPGFEGVCSTCTGRLTPDEILTSTRRSAGLPELDHGDPELVNLVLDMEAGKCDTLAPDPDDDQADDDAPPETTEGE